MFYDKLKSKLDRACGECNLCCQGFYRLTYNDELIQDAKKPCKFVCNAGCSIHDKRPLPCMMYMCLYKTNFYVPQWMKPNLSKVIMVEYDIKNTKILFVKTQATELDDNVIDWICMSFKENKFTDIIFLENTFALSAYYLTSNKDKFNEIKEHGPTIGLEIQSARNCNYFNSRLDNLAN